MMPNEKEKKTDFTKLECINISFNRPVKWYMYIVKLILKNKDVFLFKNNYNSLKLKTSF